LNGLSQPEWERTGGAPNLCVTRHAPRKAAAQPGVKLLFTADVVYDAAMTSSLIATPNRRSPPLVQGYGMTPGRRMAGTSPALEAPVDRVRFRVEAE